MVSPLKIEINGTIITGRIGGIEGFTVTFRRKGEDNSLTKSFSSELTFYDDGYSILKAALIDPFDGFSKEVNVKIYDDCCGSMVFEGIIRGDAIDWCEQDCTISANIIENKPEINCIKNTIIWDNHNGFTSTKTHPIVRYCIETQPEFLHYCLIFTTAFITLVADNILKIIQWITSIFDKGAAEDIKNLRAQIASITIQCGRFHPSPYVRDYINNVCQKCGLSFKSSILNDVNSQYGEYYNLVLTSAQIRKGRELVDTNYRVIADNLPVETLQTLLDDYLVHIFNADYRVSNGVLEFERKDYFVTNSITWIDAMQLLEDGRITENTICWSWIDKERWAFGDYEYMMDASDYWGNMVRRRWNDIVDWYQIPSQSGYKKVRLNAGAAHFREDDIDTSIYDWLLSPAGKIILTFLSIVSNPFNPFAALYGNNITDTLKEFKKVMIIPKHTFFSYKFLIYYPEYDRVNYKKGRIKEDYNNAFCGGDPGVPSGSRFNYPMWFQKTGNGGVTLKNNLYSNFHYIDDPMLPGTEQFDFNFTFKFDCGDLANLSFEKTIALTRNGQPKIGKIEEVQVNFINRTMQVKGIS